jgi:hypothetical protein
MARVGGYLSRKRAIVPQGRFCRGRSRRCLPASGPPRDIL